VSDASLSERITIDGRFNGPPESGHGGYVCGIVASLISGQAEVTLRRPPPLDRPLEIVRLDGGGVALRDGETVIVEGAPTSVETDVPEPVSFPDAETASESYVGAREHAFPTCFGCGPRRAEGDGLRIFPGLVEGRDVVAAPWTPDAALADADGTVRPEFVWAALDCSGGWALLAQLPERPVVLGRLAAKLLTPVRASERCVVIGWPLGEDGRKMYSGTALFSEEGKLRAFARATWVRLA
jgi:hypothetical protein